MIIYGKQVFFYALKHHKEKIEELYLAKKCDKAEFKLIASSGIPLQRPDFIKAQALARGGNHQGYLMKLKEYEFADFNKLKNSSFLVLLYGLSDVGNIGAIARTAYALGVDGILVQNQSLKMEGVIRTSSGAALCLPFAMVESKDAINELRQVGFKIHASGAKGIDIRNFKPSSKQLLVLGSEGEGIPKKLLEKCDDTLSVKLTREFDSLNVSSAFAILCDRMRG